MPYQYVIVVGAGRLGSVLANTLSRRGSSVVVVDRDETAFRNLAADYSGFKVTGDAAELAVLRQAGVDGADCLLAVTASDNVNLMVAQVAREIFRVGRVVARVSDPGREPVYRHLDIDTISPTALAADALLAALEGSGR
jgi:trk system potassium uptake protein TrkA